MKIPDVNLLLYAHNETAPFHEQSLRWLKSALSDRSEVVGIPVAAAMGFIRVITNPRVFAKPLTFEQACTAVESWLEAGATLVNAEPGHFYEVNRLLSISHGGANLVLDAHLAALAIQNRATLYSNDRDFQRFPGLRLRNPIDQP